MGKGWTWAGKYRGLLHALYILTACICITGTACAETTGSVLFRRAVPVYPTNPAAPSDHVTIDESTTNTYIAIDGNRLVGNRDLETSAGHPLLITTNTLTGLVDLATTGGTHLAPTPYTMDCAQQGLWTFDAQLYGEFPPSAPSAPSATPIVFRCGDNSISYWRQWPEEEPPFFEHQYTAPSSYMDIVHDYGAGDIYAYRFKPEGIEVGLQYQLGPSLVIPGVAGQPSVISKGGLSLSSGNMKIVGGDVLVGGGTAPYKASISGSNGAIYAGNPSGGNLAWGGAGSVNCEYALVDEDVHAQGRGYFREGLVAGFGRQMLSGNDGSVWIETSGTLNGSTIVGQQATRVYTDSSGWHAQNHYNESYKGSVSSWFTFDDAIGALGDIYTSGSAKVARETKTESIRVGLSGQVLIEEGLEGADIENANIEETDVAVTTPVATDILCRPAIKSGGGTLYIVLSEAAPVGGLSVNWVIIHRK